MFLNGIGASSTLTAPAMQGFLGFTKEGECHTHTIVFPTITISMVSYTLVYNGAEMTPAIITHSQSGPNSVIVKIDTQFEDNVKYPDIDGSEYREGFKTIKQINGGFTITAIGTAWAGPSVITLPPIVATYVWTKVCDYDRNRDNWVRRWKEVHSG